MKSPYIWLPSILAYRTKMCVAHPDVEASHFRYNTTDAGDKDQASKTPFCFKCYTEQGESYAKER